MGEQEGKEEDKAMENAQGVSGVVEQDYKASSEDIVIEDLSGKDMTIIELREAVQTFIMQTSQIRPISFHVAINALMNLYCFAMLSFQSKEEAIKGIKEHFETVVIAIENGEMGPGLIKDS